MKLQLIHNYFFYRFYKAIKGGDFNFWTEWRALLLLIILEMVLFFVLIIPINLIFRIELLSKGLLLGYAVIMSVKNYFMYDKNNNWKIVIDQCKQLPKSKEKTLKYIFWITVLASIPVLVTELYILGKIRGNI